MAETKIGKETGSPGGIEPTKQGSATVYLAEPIEYNTELAFPNNIAVFDKMRADSQVQSVLNAIHLPIISAQWDLHTEGVDDTVVQPVRTELRLPEPGQAMTGPAPTKRSPTGEGGETVMTIGAEKYEYVIGIDTHARIHTYAIINTRTGARQGCQSFPVTIPGMNRAIAWIRRNTQDEILAAVEGTRSYGSTITHALTEAGITVVEVKPPRKKDRAGVGKTDEIDATAAAMGILSHDVERLLHPRSEGVRSALNILVASRQRIDSQRTANRNALNALVRELDFGIDARKALTDRQVRQISNWREHPSDTVEQR